MKSKKNIFIRLIRFIISVFDKYLISPITKLILKIIDLFKSNTKTIDKFLSKKSTLLICSLVLAFATFLVVDSQSSVLIDQYAEILYDQQVTAVYNEASYVVEGLPEKVDITLIGQRRHIFLAKQSPSKGVSVDLTGLKPGNHKVTLKYTQRISSLDYKLDPSQVTVTIYEKVSETKNLTYDILHQDELDSKLYINSVNLDRDNVIIKGAQYKLDTVASVKALIDVNDISNAKSGDITLKDVPLVAYDNEGNIVNVEIVPGTVDATINITSPSKEIPIRVIPKGSLAFGKSIKSIETSVNNVTVYGRQDAIDEIENLDVEIEVGGLDKDKDFNITLKKPNGITDISSKTITVKVKVDNSISKEFENISIQSENLEPGYKVQALTENDRQVTVVVKGSEGVVNSIDVSDIKAYINLKGYGVGEHEVEVKVTGNDNKLTYTSKTKKVKIKITQG